MRIALNHIKQLYQLLEEENFGYSATDMLAAETRLGVSLPEELKSYYTKLGKQEDINQSHNHLLAPEAIYITADDYLVFYEENQAVVVWGVPIYQLKDDVIPVYGNYGNADEPNWHQEAKHLSEFFCLMAITNGVLGGFTYNANVIGGIVAIDINTIEKEWKRIPNLGWEKEQYYTLDFDAILSLSYDEHQQCTAVFLGTQDQDLFEETIASLDIDWDYIATEDE